MSLNFSELATNILTTYNSQKNNLVSDNERQTPYPKIPGTEWMDSFKINYDNDSNNGSFTKTSVVMEAKPSLLGFTIGEYNDDNMIADTISKYWKSQIKKGVPVYSSIVAISNDAEKIRTPIENYLHNLSGNTESKPYYEHLFSFIESQVKTIIWTVDELDSSSPKQYTVKIS